MKMISCCTSSKVLPSQLNRNHPISNKALCAPRHIWKSITYYALGSVILRVKLVLQPFCRNQGATVLFLAATNAKADSIQTLIRADKSSDDDLLLLCAVLQRKVFVLVLTCAML